MFYDKRFHRNNIAYVAIPNKANTAHINENFNMVCIVSLSHAIPNRGITNVDIAKIAAIFANNILYPYYGGRQWSRSTVLLDPLVFEARSIPN